jgi:hypothetical protein
MQARSLFARMTTIKANAKKMKIIFKKYLEFEMKFGSFELLKKKLKIMFLV